MKPILRDSFSWDEEKAPLNERKHGIAFELAATVFDDPLAVLSRDVDHESAEDRWVIVGMTDNGRLLLVVHTVDQTESKSHVRIISARKATQHERREYESGDYSIREPVMTDDYGVEDESELEGKFDFSNPIRGKFANVRFPIFIDNSILGYFHVRARATGIRMEELVNEALRHHVNAAGYVPPVFPAER